MSAVARTRARLVAGLDLGAGAVRVALVETDEDGRRRVVAVAHEPLEPRAVERGVVRDPDVLERAVRAALARAEELADRRAELLVAAVSADDLRVYRHVWRATRSGEGPVSDGELRRAGDRARADAARAAVIAIGDEPGLRRVALATLQAVSSRAALDGRPLIARGRQRGEVLEVELVVPVLPLAQSTGLEAALEPLGRRSRFVAAPLALAALLAESGVEDATLVVVGSDLTSVAVLRDGAPAGARAFSVGASRLAAGAVADDAHVWASCAALAAGDAGGTPVPARVLVAGAEPGLAMGALAAAFTRLQPAVGARVEIFEPALLVRIQWSVAAGRDALVAVAAGAS